VHGCIVEEENVDNTRKSTELILKNNGSTEHTESLVDSVDRDMSTENTEGTEKRLMSRGLLRRDFLKLAPFGTDV